MFATNETFLAMLAVSAMAHNLMLFGFAAVSLLLIVLVLLQKGEGGLGGALGGGSADSLFGVRSLSTIKYATAVVAGLFFIASIVIAKMPETVTQDTRRNTGQGLKDPEASSSDNATGTAEGAVEIGAEESKKTEEKKDTPK